MQEDEDKNQNTTDPALTRPRRSNPRCRPTLKNRPAPKPKYHLFLEDSDLSQELPEALLKPNVSSKPKRSQAQRVVDKFGSVLILFRALQVADPDNAPKHSSTVHRWLYPRGKNSGTGGVIPLSSISSVQKAARFEGIFLDEEDLFPGDR